MCGDPAVWLMITVLVSMVGFFVVCGLMIGKA